ncbi:MAG: HipA domain-containing protein [Bacteroidia bacterium]
MKNYKKKHFTYTLATEPQLTLQEPGSQVLAKCLYCYQPLNSSNANFHQTCNKKFFGQLQTPLLAYNNEQLSALADKIIHSQMAVTGVQAKVSLSINRNDEKSTVKKLTIVGLYGDYILKPPSEYYAHLPEVEDLTMHLAEVCGLKTVPHSLVYLQDGTLCYLTKRVDRTKKGKLHMEDMCQLTERQTEDKYKGSHEQVAKTLLKYSANPLFDVTNFYELVVFSFLTGNADMHLKNFSLLENTEGDYTLAPAYDLVATALVNKADKEELALTLNGKKNKLNYNDFLTAFETSGLSKKVLDNTLENFFYCKKEMEAMVKQSFLTKEYQQNFLTLLNKRYQQLNIKPSNYN